MYKQVTTRHDAVRGPAWAWRERRTISIGGAVANKETRMAIIGVDGSVPEGERRARVFAGEIFCLPPSDTVAAFCDFAWDLIERAFGGLDPSEAHTELAVDEYVKILGPLKTTFTHHEQSKRLLRD